MKLSYTLHLASLPGKQGITLRKRLLLYLMSMSLMALGIMIIILVAAGVLFNSENDVSRSMKAQLNHNTDSIQETLDFMMGYGRNLSGNLSREITNCLDGKSIESINNNPEEILKIEKAIYPEVNITLKLTRSSGCYVALNATINTDAPNAEFSRAGIYLRLSNVNSNVQLDPDIYYFRGIPDIAREKELQLHNRWNLEFDLQYFPEYTKFDSCEKKGHDADFWSNKKHLQNTWEDTIFYVSKIEGNNGEFYGVCGVDLCELFMQLSYPVGETEFGPIITVIAPIENDTIRIQDGLVGGQGGTWLNNVEKLTIKERDTINYYKEVHHGYYGYHSILNMPGEDGTEWGCAVLVPEKYCDDYITKGKVSLIIGMVIFITTMALISILISKRFVTPIVNSFDSIMSKEDITEVNTGISEIDLMIDFLNSKSKTEYITLQELPENIEELFKRFSEGVNRLTSAEYNVFRLYVEGYSISEMPEVAFISMSTVKKHNRNIYEKLNISSYEELMLYLDLFKRCDRMSELER